MRRTTACWFFQ